jgi:hypothetical protein
MFKVIIESLTFESEVIELIELHRNGTIRIHLSDFTVGQHHKQFEKWINLCGTYDKQVVESVTIGKNHFDNAFVFSCTPSPGIPGRTADNIDIELIPKKE